MTISEFVDLLAVDWDAVLALAGIMAVGIAGVVQTLKVLQILQDVRAIAYVVVGTALVELGLVIAGYFFPAFIPIGLFIFGAVLAAASAVNGWKYAFTPLIEKLFPKAEISTEDLNDA